MKRINLHLPDPELYGVKRRRRKLWILGAILFGSLYGDAAVAAAQ